MRLRKVNGITFGKKSVENDNNLTIAQVLTNAEKTIQQALVKHSLKTSDLDSKFADWEEQLKKLDSKDKIRSFQQQIQQDVQEKKDKKQQSENNKDNSLSLSAKIAIGGGIVLVILVLVGVVWMRKKKKFKK